MRLKKKVSQHRRDFQAIYECDWDDCRHEQSGYGYDDANFHENVIPRMECKKCGRPAAPDTPKTAADVPAGVVL
jgi:hypothetical protein